MGERKALIPSSANDPFNDRENQESNPATAPAAGPMVRVIKKKSPPALGIAVIISATLSIPVAAKRPAKK